MLNMSSSGGNNEFTIDTKKDNNIKDHPLIIHIQIQ
jgi:hypothetical protein